MARFVLDIKNLPVSTETVKQITTDIEDILGEYFDNGIRVKCIDFSNNNQFNGKEEFMAIGATNELTPKQIKNFKYICGND